jgi:glycine dehydrogenase subunit 1
MAHRVTRRNKFIIASTINPQYKGVIEAYTRNLGFDIRYSDYSRTGTFPFDEAGIDKETAAVVVQSPNFVGCVEDLESIAEKAHEAGALLIVIVSEAISLGLLKSPGECGADIVAGEAQSFGIPLSFGGPYCGLFATREQYVRQMPGRLVGEASDSQGRRGYVLTLSTREQHIRREKATSNICTNQGLFALMATVYLATMGRRGVQEVARQNYHKAHYAASQICTLDGFGLKFSAPFFNEFVIQAPEPAAEINRRLIERQIIGGLSLESYSPDFANCLLVCVTETADRQSLDQFVAALKQAK